MRTTGYKKPPRTEKGKNRAATVSPTEAQGTEKGKKKGPGASAEKSNSIYRGESGNPRPCGHKRPS